MANNRKLLQAQMNPEDYNRFESQGKELGLKLADYTRLLIIRELDNKTVFNSLKAPANV